VLSAGLLQPAAAYAEYGQRAASWGMVAFLRDDPGLLQSSSTIADDVAYEATTWVQAQNAAGPLAGKLDTTKVGLAGHSRGGQVSLLAAEGTAKGKIAGVFGFDPVDGSPAALTSIASIGVPLAFLGETTDSTGSMPCAPAAQNFEALYTAAASPAVAVTIVGADHTMFEDPTYCQFCSFCTAGTANGANVRALSARYMTAFFAREMLGDASVGAAFEGAGSGLDVAGGVVTLQSK
jgi:dienelactone hydrolase